jgi:dynein heavy chain
MSAVAAGAVPPTAYTAESLIPDCVGRYITNSSGAVQLVHLINGKTYAACWQAFIYWIASQYKVENSCNIAPIGVISFTRQSEIPSATAVRTAASKTSARSTVAIPTFRFYQAFLEQFSLQQQDPEAPVLVSHDVSAQRMNLLTLSKMAGCESLTFRTAMSHICKRLGEVLATGETVYIDMGVGALSGANNVVTFAFYESFDMPEGQSSTGRWAALEGSVPGGSDKPATGAAAGPRPAAVDAAMRTLRKQYALSPRKEGGGPAASASSSDAYALPAVSARAAAHLSRSGAISSARAPAASDAGANPIFAGSAAAGLRMADSLPSATASQFVRRLKGSAPLDSIRATLELARSGIVPGANGFGSAGDSGLLLTTSVGNASARGLPSSAQPPSAILPPLALQSLHETGTIALGAQPPLPAVSVSGMQARANAAAEASSSALVPAGAGAMVNMPPVLDSFARTRAATVTGNRVFASPSAKIASFFTPEAAGWAVDALTGHLAHTGYVPCVVDRTTGSWQQVLELYNAVRHGMSSDLGSLSLVRETLARASAGGVVFSSSGASPRKPAAGELVPHGPPVPHSLVDGSAAASASWMLSPRGAVTCAGPLIDDQQVLLKSFIRYQVYVEKVMDDAVVAPIKEELIRHALRLLSARVSPVLTPQAVEELIRTLLVEVKRDYTLSVKRSILDYVLMNPAERARLGIPYPPPVAARALPWGLNLAALQPPLSWRYSIERSFVSLSKNLFCNNSAMLALLSIWTKYKDVLLFDLPAASELPMSMDAFEARQRRHLVKVHKVFATQWADECEQVMRRYAKDNSLTDNNSGRFFESVASLMSIQLRTIMHRSAAAYHAFFVQYVNAPAIQMKSASEQSLTKISHAMWVRREGATTRAELPPADADDATLRASILQHAKAYGKCIDEDLRNRLANYPRPALAQQLEVRQIKGQLKVTFDVSLVDIDKTALRIFDAMVSGLKEIPRVESKIFPLLDGDRCLNVGTRAERGEIVPGPHIAALRKDLALVLSRSIRECSRLLSLYDQYIHVLDYHPKLEQWLKQPHSLEEYRQEILRHRSTADAISSQAAPHVRAVMFAIDCRQVNSTLVQRSYELANQVLTHLVLKVMDKNVALTERFSEIRAVLLRRPGTTKELKVLDKRLQHFKEHERGALERECAVLREQVLFLFDPALKFVVSKDLLGETGSTWRWLQQIPQLLTESENLVDAERTRMEKQLKDRRQAFFRALEQYRAQAGQYDNCVDIKRVHEYISRMTLLKDALEKAEVEAAAIQEHENLLNLQVTVFTLLDQTKEHLRPYDSLWNLFADFSKQHNHWLKGYVFKLDAAAVEKSVADMLQTATQLMSTLAEMVPAPAAGSAAAASAAGAPPASARTAAVGELTPSTIAENLRRDLVAFKPYIPLLHILCNPGMRDRHWDRVSDIVGFDLRPDRSASAVVSTHLSLSKVLDINVDQHLNELTEISEAATKEHVIGKLLDAMKTEWRDIAFVLKKHRDSGSFTLNSDSVEEVQALLDDHLVKTQTVKGSSFAKPFSADISEWEAWLLATQAILEVWVKVQSDWVYLEPVFESDDIMKAMPEEGHMFKLVDASWRKLISDAAADLRVRNVTAIPQMLQILVEAKEHLEVIHAGLNAYLESKRRYFPRFYFLSNEDLLEIVSETRDPLRVQPHLKKCFEGVNQLEFKDNLDITAMRSSEGEEVELVSVLNPTESRGLVERWLKEFEGVMKETVLDQVSKAIRAYSQVPRIDWVLDWPGQVVLAVNNIFWTQAVAQALAGGRTGMQPPAQALRALLHRLNAELQQVVVKVRGSLTENARTTLGALLVLDIHNRDVVQELIDKQASDPNSFEWSSQLRYYWEAAAVKVRMITTTIDYGCEYIGNSSRLVITQLTDRCYRTLMMALQLNLGGAPEGPAGTGKTETTKDLAKACGMQCVVFNCSEGLNYLQMGKFFKGIATSGAWVCFDEFNRLQLEVLSVVAQQILTIQLAKERQVETFLFEETELKLCPSASVFITMNPGYAGRAELPDNLKVLFRPVAMMVPDYALIAQMSLFSFGFSEAQALATKIVATYKLCSEQLSSQDHYDYGMRAVKTVLTAAQRLKRLEPDTREDLLVLRAIVEVNLPKFLSHDVPLFQGIIKDLFPGLLQNQADYGPLVTALNSSAQDLGLQPETALIDKAVQLYETVLNRHGLMLVGLPFSGKSSTWRTLQSALNSIGARKSSGRHGATSLPAPFGGEQTSFVERELGAEVAVINPKAITIDQLYGSFSATTHEWSDGVLATKFKAMATTDDMRRQWLLFDGPVDAMWIENMNTVLDDNKKLCLMSGQIIQMSPRMNILFEVSDLAVASPATVSRCGMVYFEPALLGWRPLVTSWISQLPFSQELVEIVESLIEWLLPSCLRIVTASAKDVPAAASDASAGGDAGAAGAAKERCNQYSGQSASNLVTSLMRIFDSIMAPLYARVRDPAAAAAHQAHVQQEEEKSDTAGMDVRQLRRRSSLAVDGSVLGRRRSIAGNGSLGVSRRPSLTAGADAAAAAAAAAQEQLPPAPTELGIDDDANMIAKVEGAFLFALTWSIGASVDEDGRRRFDSFLRELLREITTHKLVVNFPKKGTVFDVSFDIDRARWVQWTDELESTPFVIPAEAKFQEIIVPTIDTVRYSYMLKMFINNTHPLLFVGPTGTGKSVYVLDMLINHLNKDKYVPLVVNFSAQTTENQVQSLIDLKVDRRRKGVFGPAGGKRMPVFLDDVNMPRPDINGVQSPAELLRQYLDYNGWYDLSDHSHSFRKFVDIQLIAAMGPPGGGRNVMSERFLRHWSQVSVTPFGDSTLTHIFSTIINWHFDLFKFNDGIRAMTDSLVGASKTLYATVRAKLLPTPGRDHYTFNLRDLARLVQGVLLSRPAEVETRADMTRLWFHESMRVFADRLVSDADIGHFLGWAQETLEKKLGAEIPQLFGHISNHFVTKERSGVASVSTGDTLGAGATAVTQLTVSGARAVMWGDYVSKRHPRYYKEVKDPDAMNELWKSYLDEFNQLSPKPMRLVMFRFAIEHLSRIARILKMPGGNALLVGLGGSGKQSLTRLAAAVMDLDVFSIELSKSYDIESWKNDLRVLLKRVGGQGKPTVFLLNDSQIKQESFLEDINSLLNIAEVPNIWAPEQIGEICDMVRGDARRLKKAPEGTPAQLMAFFTERVRANLHIVLSMSPVGDAFRNRLRMFPSLVNCCTIDWFTAWPADALADVANTFLADINLESETARETCVTMCMFHADVTQLSTEFYQQQRRRLYITPTSFLELIETFRELLAAKRDEVSSVRDRYLAGLDKLESTETRVKEMQEELEEMQPVLVRTSEETQQMMLVVQQETEGAMTIREAVAKEEAIAEAAAAAAKAIELDCANDLAEAMPVLEAALAALDTLSQQEIAEVRSMRNPVRPVRLVMECLCYMKKIPPARIPDPSGSGKMIIDFWEPSKKRVLSDPKLLHSLRTFDKDDIPPKVIKKIREYMQNPDFDLAKIKNTSRAVHSLASWIYAIEAYDRVVKHVQPKREKLAKAQADFKVVEARLLEARAQLATVEDKISGLTANLNAMQRKKAELEDKIATCATQLQRAEKLLTGLGGEKGRWTQSAEELAVRYRNLTGDVLIAAGFLAYLGPFTQHYRDRMLMEWVQHCRGMAVPSSAEFALAKVLGDPVKIRQWSLAGLPNDSFSIDNAIIVDKSRRWPLLIDPQGQANQWIKNFESNNGSGAGADGAGSNGLQSPVPQQQMNPDSTQRLIVVKLSQDDCHRKIEMAIQMGSPCLIEDLGEEIDPSLEPLLLKQVVRKGGVRVLRLGDQEIEYADSFRLYMTTQLRNPHYLPEVCTRVTLLNFMITPDGLEDQLLGIVVAKERPTLEHERSLLVVASAQNQKKLKEIEDKILEVMRQSKGNILDDENAIEVLSVSKSIANDIEEKQAIGVKTEREIEVSRSGYRPVAAHATVLFFCVSEMANIDSMYQFSLGWYLSLFARSISTAEPVADLLGRTQSLMNNLAYLLYANVSRSLFAKDKLVFATIMAVNLGVAARQFSPSLWSFIMTGGPASMAGASSAPAAVPALASDSKAGAGAGAGSASGAGAVGGAVSLNPAKEWLPDKAWLELTRLAQLPGFTDIDKSFYPSSPIANEWRALFESSEPHRVRLPEPWQERVDKGAAAAAAALGGGNNKTGVAPGASAVSAGSSISSTPTVCGLLGKVAILRCVRPDKLRLALRDFVEQTLDARFVTTQPFDLAEPFAETAPETPIIFVLSSGSDPLASFLAFAKEMRGSAGGSSQSHESVTSISLGQGQGPVAAQAIQRAVKHGGWVLLQNCHLAVSWLPELAKICVEIAANAKHAHPDFRLFLTSYPTPEFPVSILERSVKLVQQPPMGLKANLVACYAQDPLNDQSWYERCPFQRRRELRNLSYALAFFHCLVQERRTFGPLGWNLQYNFNASDLSISLRQLHMLLSESSSASSAVESSSAATGGETSLASEKALTAAVRSGDPNALAQVEKDLPLRALRYLIGECNYGGRVTDDWDRRTLNSLLWNFYNAKAARSTDTELYPLSESGRFTLPDPDLPLHALVEQVDELVVNVPPEVFGLHDNAEIAKDLHESSSLLHALVSTADATAHAAASATASHSVSGSSALAGASSSVAVTAASAASSGTSSGSESSGQMQAKKNAALLEMAGSILARLPTRFDLAHVYNKYPSKYEDSMNTVLAQECVRFNRLVDRIRESLEQLLRSLKGEIVTSVAMDELGQDMFNGTLPRLWRKVCYPTLKPLGSFFPDLLARLRALSSWVEHGQPVVTWFSGLFFPQSFLTGILQNYVRKNKLAIDQVAFDFEFIDRDPFGQVSMEDSRGLATALNLARPADGAYISGLYCDGAVWSWGNNCIIDAPPRVMFSPFPVLWLRPMPISLIHEAEAENPEKAQAYVCPLYRVSSRWGTLMTTGHSTNFVMPVKVPSRESQDKWIRRGVALISQRDD